MADADDIKGVSIRVRGLVQGVGFRPHVWRIARELWLTGDVLNDAEGVLIRAFGPRAALDAFIAALADRAPPLARVECIETAPLNGPAPDMFRIVESGAGDVTTGIVPDAATCPACLADIRDPENRRYRYPFTNCTHCGPRLSIVRAIPYDRATTSMAAFEMCPACRAEYEDPADRRFHAQPNACPVCGPRLWLEGADGAALPLRGARDEIEAAAALIRDGAIVAIKGIGGFHLACDAANEDAVTRLRAGKRRSGKPLALMARNVAMVTRYAHIAPPERAALESAAAPIVLLSRRADAPPLASSIAPGQTTLGFMLPYTPLHHLLMEALPGPIVLTSGNVSDEPQSIANDDARERLSEIADAFLMHDRDIVNRLDDSVVRLAAGRVRTVRRARGLAPAPLPLPLFQGAPAVLAMGAELKSTFCLASGGRAIVSQHIGDLEDAATHADCRANLALYKRLFRFAPDVVAVDAHPDYHATRLGEALAAERGLPIARVLHHHAHVAAVMAEHGEPLDATPVLGIAFDGLGMGDDVPDQPALEAPHLSTGKLIDNKGERSDAFQRTHRPLWGGEFLVADYRACRRVASFAPVPLIGGAKAMREPWRNLLAHLDVALGWDEASARFGDLSILRRLAAKPVAPALQMMARGVNAPPASSAGRLFDAVAAALGICFDEATYEGQAAVELEALAASVRCRDFGRWPIAARKLPSRGMGEDGGPIRLGWGELWQAVLDDLARDAPPAIVAARFHAFLADTVADTARALARRDGLRRIVLCGGVFHNRLLLEGVLERLAGDFEVLAPALCPAGDGAISLGQAVIAAARAIPASPR
ncbi:(NiFe) hydrogenase maturation protein HypF [Rhodomicrobium vannielii ATCC 17100]|uniref:Carbamoyltransferase HypF n=1 Tax=Rhodomicrobium vannielii (strain ATCC 17100 / DSM 162 / LMG 4299 / NCIMB 10020 / ATH 3.1.1) TaxID=648757 RepID=E3I2H4_RHOVT|nr:carbamoyltransferase HypF [Rhodomicrobium vannielii]ADP70258.1 (NiFe) hydrogenase maturation protein HypF [Rhodomicrobium vannielii ATCC 17100]